MRFSAVLVAVLALMALSPFAAHAEGKVVQCGQALKAELETVVEDDYCNFYPRTLVYVSEQAKFKKMLQERQKSFNAPREQAYADYKKALNTYYNFGLNLPAKGSMPKPSAEFPAPPTDIPPQ